MSRNPISAEERLEALSRDKARLLELLLEKKSTRIPPIRPYPRTEGEGGLRLPTSGAQQRLWFIDQLEGGSAAYHIPVAIRLRGHLDRTALQAALDTLIARHEALRTIFEQVDGEPVQRILPESRFALQLWDVQRSTVKESEAEALRHSREELTAAFDLGAGPLIRGRLLRLSEDEHLLLMTMHHIVSDGWSIGVLVRELGALYGAYIEGRPNPLSLLPLQYADYAQWQRQWLTRTALQAQLAHWKTHLQGAPELLELPTDRPRPAVQSHRGTSVALSLGPDLTEDLKTLSRTQGLTMAMTLYAAWSILLSRLAGQDDLVIGMPVANRPRIEFEGLIGFFVNTLAVRVQLGGDPKVSDLLQRVKESMLGAYANQEIPFEEVVKVLQPARTLSHSPIFQVMFALQNTPRGVLSLPGLALSEQEVPLCTAQFDLLLSLQESADDISGNLGYATDLFDAATIQRWIGSFKSVLRAMVREPQLEVSKLSLMNDEERRRVTELFNSRPAPRLQERLIHQLFEDQVERTPRAVAVICDGGELTYAELNCKANQLARFLVAEGVGPDRLVAICVERGLEMIVGLLGILKAGGCYVPLDPHYPTDRLHYMLEDAAPQVLLTQSDLKTLLPVIQTKVIAIDEDWSDIAQQSSNNLDLSMSGLSSDHLAYVIYTSGSTGKPKGVMVEHGNVARLFSATAQWFHFNERDVWTMFHSFAFDFSVWELWGALLYGGRLVVVPYLTARSPQEFYRLLCEEGVTVLNQTPSAFMQLIHAQAGSTGERHSLRVVIFGGEALELRTLQPWVKRNGTEQPQLVNMYGITETTVHVTYRPLSEEEVMAERGSMIGKPIPDLQAYLLDRHLQPVPIGVAGEMYIGGAGVARGYLNRPELTQQRFLPDPFGTDLQARLYRTGDLGRWRVDGTIEYLGRNDHQVKIRGFRIELGEIEAQLVLHGGVKEAVVIAREDSPGEKRLVAYVVLREPHDPVMAASVQTLRAHLMTVLPEYMIPSAYVMLDHMPLTTNGKLDRRALPAPELGAFQTRHYEPPQGEVEEIIAGIWEAILHMERVGRNDNFFELGGHSLLIMQMMERLRRVGLSTGLRSVFESPTLADLANELILGSEGEITIPPNLIPAGCTEITPQMLTLIELEASHIDRIAQSVPGGVANIQDVYPLAPLQEGILFHHLFDRSEGDAYVVPMALSVSSRERLDALIAALQVVIDRHDILRTAILWDQLPRPVQVVYRQVNLSVEGIEIDRSRDTFEQLREWIRPERQRLDLRNAPLIRLHVAADANSERWYALLQLHHIACDHVTTEIVISEVVALLEGRTGTLPESMPYRNHVAQALAYAKKQDSETFFRGKLREIDEPTAPYGLLDVHGSGSQIQEAYEKLKPELAKRVRTQARRLCVSAATMFHAAWSLVVAHTSRRTEVVFGSVLLGRLQGNAGAQRTLGMFINTLPLRLQLRGTTAIELVEHTQRELIELLGHEQAALAVAQRCSGIIGSAPLFTALLNYRHSVPNPASQWSSARGIQMLAGQERTNYPITLSVDDLGEGFTLKAQTDQRIDPHRMTGYLNAAVCSLVEALEQAPQTPALQLSILHESERRQVVEQFNSTQIAYPQGKLIHQLLEEQVQRTPNAMAVIFGEQSLTYGELNGRANQLARYLRGKGVGPDHLVAICVERNVEMVVGLVAILKAGAAYIPLDPHYPIERLQQMLADSAPQVLLTQEKLKGSLPATDAEVIPLDTQLAEIERCSPLNVSVAESTARAQSLVYVIYTSGSTGCPKGIAMPHCSMVNLIEWHRRNLPLSEGQRVLQFAALSFDVAFQETFSTLCLGGTLVMVEECVRRDARALMALLRDQAIERLFVPPLMLQSLAECFEATNVIPGDLRDVITAGEQLRISPEISGLFRRVRGCRLHNHYGPTETHVVTALTLTDNPEEWPIIPTIGRPISNSQIYILDAQGQPTPFAIPGELYIGGAGVAQGYLNQPDLTAARFLSDPFSATPQSRMYKTGDLARWCADGTIEYLGRNDDQVKIRGFRIELGDIESQLARHVQVRQAAVIAREDVPGEKRLVAYVTAFDQGSPSVEELRSFLKALLPEYMIPSAFVVLDNLPLTPSGKLNRRALPAPELDAYASYQYEPPEGEVEEVLAEIWQELLHVKRIGRRDNFFEFGGHSLHGMKLIIHVEERLNVRLSVIAAFQYPTIREMASVVESLRVADGEPGEGEGDEFEQGVIFPGGSIAPLERQ